MKRLPRARYHNLLLLWVSGTLAACSGLPFGAAPTPPPIAPPSNPSPPPAEPPPPLPIASAITMPTANTASPIPALDPLDSADEFTQLAAAAATRQTRDQVELARELGNCREQPVACPLVPTVEELPEIGDRRVFYVSSQDENRTLEIEAELRYLGPRAELWVELGARFNQAELDAAARTFEAEIYPLSTALFAPDFFPQITGRVTILNATTVDQGTLGYFAARDSLPRQVNRFSNERDMFVMNIANLRFGGGDYLDVLAHEFQHMLHRSIQAAPATWFNEGLSNLAEDLNGFVTQGYALTYLQQPDTQLTSWSDQPNQTIQHYGAAHLFSRYLYAQYAADDPAILPALIRADAGHNPEQLVALAAQRRPEIATFAELFGDFAVTNLVNDPAIADGRFAYLRNDWLPTPVRTRPLERGETRGDVAQFGADYLELPQGPLVARFQGDANVLLTGQPVLGSRSWWATRSDGSVATLTRPIDLRSVSTATLRFSAWYEIEIGYDYAFVTVSRDGGQTWETLPTRYTTTDDPHGHNYGHGLTGVSGSTQTTRDGAQGLWVEDEADLSAYAGAEVLLRFWQINDEGFNAPGIMLDNIAIDEIGFRDDLEGELNGWEAAGFVPIDGDLAQLWELRLVRTAADGQITVERLSADALGAAEFRLADGERAVLVISGATPFTTERTNYRMTIE